MEKKRALISIIVGLFVFLTFTVMTAKPGKCEDITITTYYPAPYGVYKALKVGELILEPLDEAPTEPVDGMLFFSSGAGKDSEGNKIVKGVWVCSGGHWYPLMILEEKGKE